MVLMNTTFENIQIGNSIVEIQPLLYLRKIKIDTNGDVLFNTLTITNWSLSFLNIYSTSGNSISIKNIEFDNITISDSVYNTRDDLIAFGPILTKAQLSITMRNAVFNNLNFVNLANMIHINVQAGVPFTIENCSFTNIWPKPACTSPLPLP